MRKLLLAAGVAAAALIPTLALGADGNMASGRSQAGGDHRDVDGRAAWMERRIRSASDDGALNRDDTARDLGRLSSIRSREAEMRAGGELSASDEAYLQFRLDRLSEALQASLGAGS